MISFILCVRDRKEHAVHSLFPLFTEAAACGGEVIVVDQDSAPDAAAYLETACISFGAMYIRLDRGGPFSRSWTLNVGARAATKPILSFCDVVVVIDQVYAEAVIQKYESVFHGGPCVVNCFPYKVEEEPSERFRETGDMSILRDGDHWPWWTLGAGAHVDAESFRAIGGFDEGYDGWGCEDDDLFQRLRALGCGWAIASPAAKCWHLWHPPAPKKDEDEPPNRRRLEVNTERMGRGDLIRNTRREWGDRSWAPLEGEDGN